MKQVPQVSMISTSQNYKYFLSPNCEIQISGKAVYLAIHKRKAIIKHPNNLDINLIQVRKD
jgi:hypothetical protein